MKHVKKLASLLLAMVMVLSMTTTAFAKTGSGTDNNGKITISNTVEKAEYAIYRIFDLESFDDSTNAYSYKVNSSWTAFFVTNAEGSKYVTIDENGYVTWIDDKKAADFAAAAIKYATDNKITTVGEKKTAENDTPVVFDSLPLGYYLVDSSVGALCALTTTDPEVSVIEKNSKPSLEKQVKENSTEDWGDKNDANIGDTVEFKATITVQGVAKDYVMHDKMDDGLTYENVTKVEKNGAVVDIDGNYSVTTDVTHTQGETSVVDTFDVIFTESFCDGLKSGDVIVVYYTATLNGNAVVKEPENNNAHLEYKDNNDETHNTPDSNTKTYTWELPVLKYANGDTTKLLAGAKFKLYKTEGTAEDGSKTYSNPVKFKTTGTTNTYVVTKDETGVVEEITTDTTGRFKLDGLDEGTYYLQETEAPAGYNKLNTIVKVVINHDGQINAEDKDENGTIEAGEYVSEIGVNNNSGSELPETGGIGTTIFYVLGGILVVAAAILLVTKKRMSAEK